MTILTTTKWWSFDHHFPPSLFITISISHLKHCWIKMGNQQPTNTKERNEVKQSQDQRPVSASQSSSALPKISATAKGNYTKSSEASNSDPLPPIRGRVPPSSLQNFSDMKHTPTVDAASSSNKTPESQGKQTNDFEQMYAHLMLKLSNMDNVNDSTPVCLITHLRLRSAKFVNEKRLKFELCKLWW